MKGSYLYILLVFFVLASCKFQHSNKENILADTLLAKTIVFPKSLLIIDGTTSLAIDTLLEDLEGKIKIVSIVDGSCLKCIINQLNYTDSIFNSIVDDSDKQLIFILNVNKEDSVYFMRYSQPFISATGVVLWDSNYSFERENKLFTTDIGLRTFMLNRENKIVQYGSPVLNPDIVYEYKRMLELY